MTMGEARNSLLKRLSSIYDERESLAIADWVMEHLTGWDKVDRVLNKKTDLPKNKIAELARISEQLMAHKPVQYILNEAWFHGMKLYVDENVLIPRPETEELVEWMIEEVDRFQVAGDGRKMRVLDVGTGSGCIPIAIKKARPFLEVQAFDLSEGALMVAKRNAIEQNVELEFRQLNFLMEEQWEALPEFDVIISNPPYIAEEEKALIDKHVIEYEPHLALFVPTEDSLVFYKQLAHFGKSHLNASGFMMTEIHFAKAEAVKNLFEQNGYGVELKKDLQGKDRMIKIWKSH